MIESQLTQLQKRLGYRFKKHKLLMAALTHSSYANEKNDISINSNERLEFLGDSVLGLAVADLIFNEYPKMTEGQMTKLRAELVCEKSLLAFAEKLELGNCLLLGRGEEKSGGRARPSILADAVEAVIAAMYLDGGFDPVSKLLSNYFSSEKDSLRIENRDHKTLLQEVVQEKSGQILSYKTVDESGPDHMKQFTVEVSLNGAPIGRGTGKSKKEAEQAAASAALASLDNNCVT